MLEKSFSGYSADLGAVLVDDLPEKPVLVEEADADEGDVQVAGRLQVVAGEGAEAAGVDGQALVEAVFRRKVGDRLRPFHAVERPDLRGGGLVAHVVVELLEDLAVEAHVAGVFRGLQEPLGGDGLQHPDGIVAHPRPELGVQGGEEFAGAGIPGPPEVVGEFPEPGDLRGEVGHRREGPEVG